MLKDTRVQIILILTIVGIIIASGMGIFISKTINNVTVESSQQIEEQKNNIKQITISSVAVIVVISTATLAFVLTNSKIAEKKLEKELNDKLNEASRQKKQLETILLHMTDGIIAFDLNGDIIHINHAAIKLLSIDKSYNNFDKIFKKINVDINMEKIIYLENWTSSEQKVNLQDRYVNILFAPYKDENDRPAGVIAVIQDITEHVKLDNMRKEFIADVSHELKTPITSIMGYSDTLLEGEYEKDVQQRFLGVISSEARRMARLVSDLLTLSKYDNNQNKAEKTEFDLGELVKSAQEGLNIEIQKKNLDIECFVTANVPMVYADKYGIQRVVINILTNSIKYTRRRRKN